MAINRRNNTVNQLRIDTPYLRSIESAVCNDFDSVSTNLLTGEGKSYIVRGFEINMIGAISSAASGLQLLVSNSSFLHGTSSVSGTFFNIPTGSPSEVLNSSVNTKVIGSFVANSVNYVGIEFNRSVDSGTSGQVYLWNPSTKTEISKTLPLAETLSYNIVITSSIWASNVLPIATVTTDISNNVASISDSRPMYLRLGTAGYSTPNPFYSYKWDNQVEGRVENPYIATSETSPFRGGDKQILNLKEWMDAIMTSVKEIKGTTYWYGDNTGGSVVKLRSDLANLMMTGKGNLSHSATIPGRINWSEDIFFNFIGSRISYKILANPATTQLTMADDQVAYIKLVRGLAIVPNLIFSNGITGLATSVGAITWTNDVSAGDYVKLAFQDDTHYYKIQSVDSASQVTFTSLLDTGDITDISGAISQYAWGTYQAAAVPSTDRHIRIVNRKDVPFNEDSFWLFLREDNSGSIAKVYIRGGGGGDLQQGETRQVSDETSQEVLNYIGSPSETTSTPIYTDALVVSTYESFTITVPNSASITTGQYLLAYSAKNTNKYYFWVNLDSAGGNPYIVNTIGKEVAIYTGNTNIQNAAILNSAFNSTSDFNSIDNLDGTISVSLAQFGPATDASNVNISGLSIVINTQGLGESNHYINDNENLTKSIKRLDEQLNTFITSVTDQGYEEDMAVVISAANTNQITGPVVVSTIISLPLNSINNNIQQGYIVGSGKLNLYLNGQRLSVNSDYSEVGTVGNSSVQIQILEQLEIDDVLKFEIESNAFNSNSNSYTATNLGAIASADVFSQISNTEFQFRRLTAGSNITITQNINDVVITSSAGVSSSSGAVYTSDHAMLNSNDIALADTTTNNVTFTLPSALSYPGHIYYFKKISAANTMYLKSVLGQTLDGVDIDAVPLTITFPYESVTVVAVAGFWVII